MIEAGISDGDCVTVRRQPVAGNGDIVAAMLDGEATVKRFKREDGHVWLLLHNAARRCRLPSPSRRVSGVPGQGPWCTRSPTATPAGSSRTVVRQFRVERLDDVAVPSQASGGVATCDILLQCAASRAARHIGLST
ncbi:hypothetical protein GCM10009730_67250 [Streptomyces albidochromogenes]